MNYLNLRDKFNKNEILDVRNIINLFGPIDRRRLYEWQKKRYIKRLTNNYYIFSDANISDVTLREIANKIYAPSYIGLESALAYYGLIPEAVFQITSVTSKKTRAIKTDIADFKYRSIQKRLFWGYTLTPKAPHPFFISDPDKTMLDYLYLNPDIDNASSFEELRLNREELARILNISRLKKYLSIFAHKRLAKSFYKLIEVLDVKL